MAARLAGGELTVRAGGHMVRGVVLASYPVFFVVGSADGAEHLVRFGPSVTVALPATPSGLRPAPASGLLRGGSRWPCGSWPAAASRSASSWPTAPA